MSDTEPERGGDPPDESIDGTQETSAESGHRGREARDPEGTGPVPGERGIPSINRARSIQSRVSSMLAVGLMMTLGLGLLTWYYARILTRPSRSLANSQALAARSAQGDMPLPPLGPIPQPTFRTVEAVPAASVPPATSHPMETLLGPAPPWPQSAPAEADPMPNSMPPETRYLAQRTLDRRLSGAVFATSSGEAGGADATSASTSQATGVPGEGGWLPVSLSGPARLSAGEGGETGARASDALAGLLTPQATPAVSAQILPTLRFLLPKGAFIDCTLETAIDSTLPGMTTCITATDTFSADGAVVLLERGTKLVGETRGEVEQGQARVFVLWTEARTPSGVVVPLDSPGTDALGRSGLAGTVERHFWERFGAAILVSVIDGAIQAGVESRSSGGTVIVDPSGTQDVMTEALKSTVDIPPTVNVAQGARIQVLVARDVDFRSVYRLRTVSGSAP